VQDPNNPLVVINTLSGQPTSISLQQIVQIGMFSIVTYVVELMLEIGLFKALGTLCLQLLQGEARGWVHLSRKMGAWGLKTCKVFAVLHSLLRIQYERNAHLAGSLAFFVFRSRTSGYFFKQDVLYGGAKYIPTGRGYALRHNSFVKVYSTYARSHLYFSAELIMLLIVLALSNPESYPVTTWATWLVAVSLVWSPFWFNPQTFQVLCVQHVWLFWQQH
jgi:hypothetical protein